MINELEPSFSDIEKVHDELQKQADAYHKLYKDNISVPEILKLAQSRPIAYPKTCFPLVVLGTKFPLMEQLEAAKQDLMMYKPLFSQEQEITRTNQVEKPILVWANFIEELKGTNVASVSSRLDELKELEKQSLNVRFAGTDVGLALMQVNANLPMELLPQDSTQDSTQDSSQHAIGLLGGRQSVKGRDTVPIIHLKLRSEAVQMSQKFTDKTLESEIGKNIWWLTCQPKNYG